MRFSIFLIALCSFGSSPVLSDEDNKIFELGDFRFESGVTLPIARLSYVNPWRQAKMWQRHNVGDTPGIGGDFEKALRSIEARVLLMPSETDLYFPVADAEYESRFISGAKLVPIPSIWGHGAGGGRGPGDAEFLNRAIAEFLAGGGQ